MKYSNEFYQLLGHINPALYDVIFPMGPVQFFNGHPKEPLLRNFQTQGSVFGTDFSGDLKVPAKLSWKMKNPAEDLRAVIVQSKVSAEPGSISSGGKSFLSEIIDDYCGTTVIKFPFPPRPKWFDGQVTIEEKVGAATLFAKTAFPTPGTEIGAVLSEGADKILDSAMAQFTQRGAQANHVAYSELTVDA